MLALIFMILAVTGSAFAQNALPMGEREAFMGNVGIARDGTVGNTYFNPGGLAFNRTNKIVASGTLMANSSQESKSSSTQAKVSQTQVLPIASGTAWVKDNWAWAFSVYNINNTSAMVSYTQNLTSIGEVEGRARVDQFGLVVGPSFASKASPNLGWGVSTFYYHQDDGVIVNLPFQKVIGANTAVGSVYAEQKTLARSLKVVAGALAKFEYFNLGLRLESGPLLTQAERESLGTNIIYVKNGTTIVSESTQIGALVKEKVQFDRPHSVGVGIGAYLGAQTRIYSDLNYSLKTSYRATAADTLTEYDGGLRFGAGVEHGKGQEKWLGGATYIEDESGDNTFLYLSAGKVSLEKRSNSTLGLFYITTLKNEDTNLSMIGLLFSSTINL